MSSRGNKYVMIIYNHDSNAILAEPLKLRVENNMLGAFTNSSGYSPVKDYGPRCNAWTTNAQTALKSSCNNNISNTSLYHQTYIAATPPNGLSVLLRNISLLDYQVL